MWLPSLAALSAALLLHSTGSAQAFEGAAGMPAEVPQQVPVAQLLAGQDLAASRPSAMPPLAYPLAQVALQIDPWGWRYSESRRAWRMHTGVDFAAPTGTPVLAAMAGRVVLAEAISGYGLTVMLEHPNGVHTLYAHLEQIEVSLGSQVAEGEPLGTVGMTGTATGPHLHFELRVNGQQPVALDPTPHLPPLLPPPTLTATRP
ncbi:MAG: M23 family metallopeptidase [Prochlorococcaceae cyanobacterium]